MKVKMRINQESQIKSKKLRRIMPNKRSKMIIWRFKSINLKNQMRKKRTLNQLSSLDCKVLSSRKFGKMGTGTSVRQKLL